MTCESCNSVFEENRRLRKDNEKLKAKFHILEKRVNELEKKLMIYDNPHTPPSKRRFSSRPERSNGKPGQKNGHKGTTRPVAEPDEIVQVSMCDCPHCGCNLDNPTGYESRVIEELPEPRQARVTEFLLAHYICPGCSKEVAAMHPDCPNEGRFGKNFISLTTVMKYMDRLPYRKIRRALKRQHCIELSEATILDLTRRACDSMRPEYERILKRIRKAKVVYSDETGIKVNGKKCWIWIFVSGNDVIVVVADSRGKGVIEKTLGKDFKGILVCDGWKPYTSFTSRIQRCWAHLLREADNLAEHHNEAAGIKDELHSIFSDCKDMLKGKPPPDERKQIWNAMNARMKLILSRKYQSEEVGNFITKISNGFDYWFTFILYPYVEPTNNIAENALREHVVHRNIIGTLRNEKGMFNHETAMSVITTWDNMGLNPYEQLVGVL